MNFYIEAFASEQGITFDKAKERFLAQSPNWRCQFILSHVPALHLQNSSSSLQC